MAKRLIQSAHNRDGLPEIAMGLTFLFVGALSLAQVLLPRGSAGFKTAVFGLAFLAPVLCIGAPQAVKWVRRRYLIERVGYVESKPLGRKGMGMMIGLAFVVATVMSLALFAAVTRFSPAVTRFSHPDRWVLAGTGLLGGALAALCGKLPRFVVGGVLMAVAGILTAFSGVSLQIGFAMLFGFTGLLALVSGGVVFFRFIRQPAEPGE
ncbi:MAG TPA: hypothetical protein VKF41_10840 [Bryobacteraceae bacterium]|nr:hypothetical protein [Bryobacteraceae bacterium]